MLTAPRSRRFVLACSLPLALWAALPELRWCAFDLEQCAAVLAGAPAAIAVSECERAGDGDCASMSDCPLAHRDEAPPRGRLCVGDPNGGAGVLAGAVHLPDPTGLPAHLVQPESSFPLVMLARTTPQLASRPPPEPDRRRPPARAPPSVHGA